MALLRLFSQGQMERQTEVGSVQNIFYIHGLFLPTPTLQPQPQPPSQRGAAHHQLSQGPPLSGLDLWRGGGKEGALAQGGSPVSSAPILQRRREEGGRQHRTGV